MLGSCHDGLTQIHKKSMYSVVCPKRLFIRFQFVIQFSVMMVPKEKYLLLKRFNETVDEARSFKKTENCWNKMTTSQGFYKTQTAMSSIVATKRKHRETQSYIPVSFRIFLSSP